MQCTPRESFVWLIEQSILSSFKICKLPGESEILRHDYLIAIWAEPALQLIQRRVGSHAFSSGIHNKGHGC